MTTNHNIEVLEAVYNTWSQSPAQGSEIPERGVKLTITVRNWPQAYEPQYIVYNKRKSFKAAIADSSSTHTTIKASIIQASSMLAETSKSMDVSDRLVFSNANGDTRFIEITDWQQAKK